MFNRILAVLNLLSLFLIISFAIYFFTQRQHIVYVDAVQLVNNYKGMQDARTLYQKKSASWKANVDTLGSEVQKQIMQHDREVAKMTPKERSLSQQLIKTKQNQFIEYQRAIGTQAQQEEGEMNAKVVTQINAYLKKYGEAHGYKIIMAATEYGNIAYADEDLDITKQVLEGLNKEYTGQ